jgi:hypothetical protein
MFRFPSSYEYRFCGAALLDHVFVKLHLEFLGSVSAFKSTQSGGLSERLGAWEAKYELARYTVRCQAEVAELNGRYAAPRTCPIYLPWPVMLGEPVADVRLTIM